MRTTLAKSLVRIADSDPRIVLMTADLGFMVLEEFADAHPSRFFNVGVAEANMVGLATGLASCGYIPYIYSIATFASMRAYEQIRNGPITHDLQVRIIGIGGGFEYGHAGLTHHALEDLGIARVQPGLKVIVPADHLQAENAIQDTYDLPGPIYFRLSKRDDYEIPDLDGHFEMGHCDVVRNGSDLLIVSMGAITTEALAAADRLVEKGIETTVAVVSSLRPAPTEDLVGLMSRFKLVITTEEHYLDGGLGSWVSEVAASRGSGARVMRLGVAGCESGVCGGTEFLRRAQGLTGDQIAEAAAQALGD
jgi:transketolase